MVGSRASTRLALLLSFLILIAIPAFAQQTGSVSGRVTGVDGGALPGVTVEARSPSLPQPRVTVSDETGEYRLPALQPGTYAITFSLAGLDTVTRNAQVLLGQNATVNVALGMAVASESITVTADATLVDNDSTELSSSVGQEQIEDLPVAQEYRDLVKLAPAVQYTEEAVRGPAAGGSGQDNVYQFDGVNVTLPLFGTLSAEPSTHDIQQIEVIKGGSKAVDFNRAAGFTIDSVSKSGTNEFMGQVGFQIETESMRSDLTTASVAQSNQDRTWSTINLGGPLLTDRLFFYGSYYRPTIKRTERVNAYGDLPDYDSERNEYFGKLTYTPTASILLNGSYRSSDRAIDAASIGNTAAPTTALDEEATQDIGILEASWVINSRSYATAKFTDYANETGSIPSIILDNVTPSTAAGTRLDINNLDKLGIFVVPAPVAGQTAYNEFIAPLIQRYGYTNSSGVRTGGGEAGVGSTFNAQDFFRQSAQVGYDITFGTTLAHDVHVGYQRFEDSEDLRRSSNGWGVLRAPRGVTFQGQAVAYQAEFTRPLLGTGSANNIHSEYVSHNLEINDTIRWGDWSFNVGVMASDDTLYGQGLREDSSAVSGFVAAPGNKYEMYNIPFEKTIQPRLGATWAYNGQDNVYASYAKYVPAASSLPRAASWDRNTLGLTTRVHFDATGLIIGSESVASSSGKLFVEDLDPRYTDEFLVGTSQQFTPTWSARAYGRYRYSSNFWEDTNNNARVQWAPEGYPKDLYIADLSARLAQIGSGSTYVIAELDGAFTKYYEATLENDYRKGNMLVRGSYTWSHYYGNFDQDNTAVDNDMATFIGSSNIGDGPGRQLWDNKYGDLRGDRRHLLKLYGTYNLPWNGVIGAFGIYQSGQPWEAWNYEIYRTLPGFGTSTSDTARYAEPAGSRRSPAHYQVDMTYTQNVPIFRGYNIQFQLDAFNLLDKQTGYDFQPSVHSAQFGQARQFFDPRRFQLAVRFEF